MRNHMFRALMKYIDSSMKWSIEHNPQVMKNLATLERIEVKARALVAENVELKNRVAIKEAEAAAMVGVVMQREAYIKLLEGRANAG